MRYRLMATYRGVPYEAGMGPAGADVVLFAACPPPEELGFEPATGHWRKRVIRAEVDALWESRPIGTFRDEPCMVLDDLGERLHIAYLGADAGVAANLGYWQVDRGVFELLTPRDEVTGLIEERIEKPLRLTPSPGPAGAQSSYPYNPGSDPGVGPAADLGPASASSLDPGQAPDPGPAPGPGSALDLGSARDPGPAPDLGVPPDLGPVPDLGPDPLLPPMPPAAPRRGPVPNGRSRSARRQRVQTRDIFGELADRAAIPRAAYALETEAEGALCLMPGPGGFEVFVSMDGARHEVRLFPDEEAAYFYLFGVLAAEAVRNGTLIPAMAPAGTRHDLS